MNVATGKAEGDTAGVSSTAVAVALGLGVGLDSTTTTSSSTTTSVDDAEGDGVGESEAAGVDDPEVALGDFVGRGDTTGLADALGSGLSSGVGSAVTDGVGETDADGVGVGVGDGAGVDPPPPPPDARGVTALDADEAVEDPAALVATTVNVYAVPLVRPLTVHDVVDVEHIAPPGDDVTV